jgi:predicted TIM-barrel fold metal-dependent hydrolase
VQIFDAVQGGELAKLSNDRLAAAIERHPSRYAGLAAVAPQDPEAAAQEIDRTIRSLGLNGVLINSHTNNEFLDQQKYWPIFEATVANDVPLYLHPRRPPDQMAAAFTDYQMDRALWGFAIEASTHAVRLIMGGIFDQFPDLKVVLGHMGEGIPFWLHRLDTIGGRSTGGATIKRKPSEYFRDNFTITTSGMSWEPILRLSVEVLGANKVMFATDYPFGSYERDIAWLDGVDMPDSDKVLIYGGNAERVFGLDG